MYEKRIHRIMSTEIVIYKDGEEFAREVLEDGVFWDSENEGEITEEEAQEYL